MLACIVPSLPRLNLHSALLTSDVYQLAYLYAAMIVLLSVQVVTFIKNIGVITK